MMCFYGKHTIPYLLFSLSSETYENEKHNTNTEHNTTSILTENRKRSDDIKSM